MDICQRWRAHACRVIAAVGVACAVHAEDTALPSTPSYESQVEWHEFTPDVNMPSEKNDRLPVTRDIDTRSPRDVMQGPSVGPLPPPSARPRKPRTEKRKNWLVPAAMSRDDSEDDPSPLSPVNSTEEETTGDEADLLFGVDTSETGWTASAEEEAAALLDIPTPTDLDTESMSMWTPTQSADIPSLATPSPPDVQDLRDPWLNTASGAEAGDYETMPQTAALLSEITQPMREALQPNFGLADLMPNPSDLGLRSATTPNVAPAASLFDGSGAGTEGAAESTGLETPFNR